MNTVNMNKTLDESLRNKRSAKKANIVFTKLQAKLGGKKNPWDEVRSYTPPSMTEVQPGSNNTDTV